MARKAVRNKKKSVPTVAAVDGRRYEFIGLFLFAAGIISFISLLGLNVGFIGRVANAFLTYMFGIGAYVIPFFIMLFGMIYTVRKRGMIFSKRLTGLILLYLFFLGLYHHFSVPTGQEIMPDRLTGGGGLAGGLLLFGLRKLFGVDGTLVVLLTLELGAFLMSSKLSLAAGILKTKERTVSGAAAAKEKLTEVYDKVKEGDMFSVAPHEAELASDPYLVPSKEESFYNQEKDKSFADASLKQAEIASEKSESAAEKADETSNSKKDELPMEFAFSGSLENIDGRENAEDIKSADEGGAPLDDDMEDTLKLDSAEMQAAIAANETADTKVKPAAKEASSSLRVKESFTNEKNQPDAAREYVVPRVEDILHKVEKKVNSQLKKELAEKAEILIRTLEDFKIKAKVVNACHGPAVTRYELEPAAGVRISRIVGLTDNLTMKLSASSIRIEAPIPGKAAIGIEVPNKELSGVHLRDVLEKPEFLEQKSKLTVGLGMDIGGKAIMADIGKMPHVLVAGATGSGKSVCINTLITSILFKAKPDEVKFILIDPKMVELSNYNGIPHLLVPVVTDSMKASSVLKWAVQEMEKRYARFAACGVRDMGRYNSAQPEGAEKMPAIVIIIDELADLMMVAAKDVEDSICRLAQKARAAGIHLVLATQRPSVDIITGVIKANIPSRISFAVSSQVDSRTILDSTGAEKLLGRGDMLYYPSGVPKPMRVQGAFISDDEVEALIEYVRSQGEPEENEEIISFTENDLKDSSDKNDGEAGGKFTDEYMGDALRLVLDVGNASASFLQRRLRVGYNRAARLVELMEEMKIVGPQNGSKPRELIMSRAEIEKLLEENNL